MPQTSLPESITAATLKSSVLGTTGTGGHDDDHLDLHRRYNEVISVTDHGAIGDGVADDTVALQAAFDAGADAEPIFIPEGVYKITSTLTLDPTKNYIIEGAGYDPNMTAASVIRQDTATHAISIINSGAANDNTYILRNFAIKGENTVGSARSGLFCDNVHSLRAEHLWIAEHGDDGIHLLNCFSSTIVNCVIVHNQHHGINVNTVGNLVNIVRCRVNENADSDGGFSNINILGTSGNENLAVSVIGCDFSGAGRFGVDSDSAFGMVLGFTHSALLTGNYCEDAVTSLIFAPNTNHAVTLVGNYFQDGKVDLDSIKELVVEGNTLTRNTLATDLKITGTATADIKVGQNFLSGGATQTLVGTVIQTIPTQLLVTGAVELDGDLNHDGTNVGFYATAPIAQQTGVAVSAAGVHAALVNLGLITA